MNRQLSRFRYSRGLSLIEMMVAVLIASFLIFGLLQVFTASKASYQTSEGLARVQENARFAMEFLQRDIRMAGHFGCVNDQAHFIREEGDPVNRLTAFAGENQPLNFNVSIQGYEANGTAPNQSATIGGFAAGWNPGLPASINALNPLPGSDIIVLRYLGAHGTPVGSIGAANLTITDFDALTDEGVSSPTLFGIADCSHADVFQGAGAAGTIAVASPIANELSGRYNPFPAGQTVVYRANSIVYYVGRGTSGEPALRRARADNSGGYTIDEELVEGVESLQFLYGQDETVDISQATPPVGNITVQNTAAVVLSGAATPDARANAWRRVGLVQVGILARSPAPAAVPAASGGVNVLGVSFLPPTTGDARFRAGYESTVALRNRLFGN